MDMIIDLSLQLVAQLDVSNSKFKTMIQSLKLPGRISNLARNYPRYAIENPKLLESFLNFLNLAVSNSLIFHDESITKFLWFSIFSGFSFQQTAFDILEKIHKEKGMNEFLIKSLSIDDFKKFLPALKNEPRKLVRFLKVFTDIGSIHEKGMVEKAFLHPNFIIDIISLLEVIPSKPYDVNYKTSIIRVE